MAFTLNRRLSTLVDSSGQLKTGKIPNDYINGDHIADNVITTAMLHTGFTLPISSLTSIDTDDVTEGSTNLFYTTARVDSHLSGGTGVTYSSGAISIGQAVATTDSPTFADLTITGNLNITGDINSYNVTDLDVTDQTITLGAGQIEANSGGSGIVIDGSNASILWDETNDQFDFNKGINVDSNTLVVDGTNNRVGILNAAPDVSLDIGSSTDAIHMPVGTTAQRPSSPAAGYFRYNSDDGQFEGYTTEWGAIAGSGGSAMETNNFTGDGSTTAFTLSSSVSSEDNLIVFIEGIYQNKGDYVASGTTLTFDTAPVNGRRIVVQHIKSSVAGNSTLYTSLTGDGSTTAFTLSGAPGNENNTQVFMDGVYQQKDSYTVSGTTLTFDAAPANNVEIEVMSFTQTTINTPGAGTVTPAMIASGDFTFDTNTLAIDATNNRVGIGTNSPNDILDIHKANSQLRLTDTDDSKFVQFSYSGGKLIVRNNSTTSNVEQFTLTEDGKFGLGTHIPAVSLDVGSYTDAIDVPSGTTAQRPSSPSNGMIRYNTTLNALEGYANGNWTDIGQAFIATGGTIVSSGGYKYHTFTTSGTFTVTSGIATVDFLIVAGGGGGGSRHGGGGGAGGYQTGSYTASTGNYTVTIGAGGAGGVKNTSIAVSGGNSSVFGTTSTGGGIGGNYPTQNATSGGSGGGAGNRGSGTFTGGSGTLGQGNDGGDVTSGGSDWAGAGCGGATTAGGGSTGGTGVSGGNGGTGSNSVATWATATSTGDGGYYAGGGGGG